MSGAALSSHRRSVTLSAFVHGPSWSWAWTRLYFWLRPRRQVTLDAVVVVCQCQPTEPSQSDRSIDARTSKRSKTVKPNTTCAPRSLPPLLQLVIVGRQFLQAKYPLQYQPKFNRSRPCSTVPMSESNYLAVEKCYTSTLQFKK